MFLCGDTVGILDGTFFSVRDCSDDGRHLAFLTPEHEILGVHSIYCGPQKIHPTSFQILIVGTLLPELETH